MYAIRAQRFSVILEEADSPEGAILLSVEGERIDSGEGGTLLEAIDRCLRGGYDTFLFRLSLDSLSAIAFYDAYKKLALYDARMAFVGVEGRLRKDFDLYGLESFFVFADTIEEALSRCERASSFDASGISAAIEKAVGPDPDGLALRFTSAPGLVGSLIVRAEGDIDEGTLPRFEAKVRAAMDLGYPRLVFDMNAIRGCCDQASAAFALILRRALASEGAIALARLDPSIRGALASLAQDTAPRVFDSIEEGLDFIADGSAV